MKTKVVTLKVNRDAYKVGDCGGTLTVGELKKCSTTWMKI